MTGFVGRSDGHRTVEDLTPETLRPMLLAAEEFVVVENTDRGGQFYAQAARIDGESWRVEVRDGGPDRHLGTTAGNTDAAFDILRSWAAGDDWWRDAFGWEAVRL